MNNNIIENVIKNDCYCHNPYVNKQSAQMQENTPFILSLCFRCRNDYKSLPENMIKRANPYQTKKDICDVCQVKYGYDYIITKSYKKQEAKK